MLQFVVETVTKQPVEELMQEYVFQPFGMSRTSFVWQDRFESDYANAYDEYGRSLGPHRWKSPDAAGSMQTTIKNLATFLLAVMQDQRLSPKLRRQMLSPQVQIFSKRQFPSLNQETTEENKSIRLSYGLGWGLYSSPYGPAFFKEGHDEGWRNYAVCFDGQKSGMIILTNSSNGEGIFKELLETVLRDTFTPIEWEGYTPYDKLPPRPPLKQHKRISVAQNILDRYVGRYALNSDLVLVIRRESDHLTIQENVEPTQELLPESERDFYSTSSDDTLTFEMDANSKVTGMTLHVGKEIAVKRIE